MNPSAAGKTYPATMFTVDPHRVDAFRHIFEEAEGVPATFATVAEFGVMPQIVADPENASEVEVRFIAESPERTRVELEHRNLDRHGPGWESVSDGVAHDEGWPLYLTRYAALFTEGS